MNNGKSRLIVILTLLSLIVFFHLFLVKKYYFFADDAFISFRYLKNWLSGAGLVFNPGERVEGYTNFLWIVLLAVPSMLGIPPEKAAPLLSAIASVILLVVVFFSRRIALNEKGMPLSWLPGPLFLVLMRTYNIWATGGLETRLFSLLAFLGGLFAIRAVRKPQSGFWIAGGLVFALAELTRPEGALFFITAALLVLIGRHISRQQLMTGKDLAGHALFLLIVGGHYLGRYLYYDSWLPNTFYAKVGGANFRLGVLYLGIFCLEYALYFWILPLVYFIVRGIRSRDIFLYFWLLFFIPFCTYLTYVGGDHFEYRFLDPVLPAISVVLSHILIKLVRTAQGINRKRLAAAAAFTFIFLVYQQAPLRASGMDLGREYRTGLVPAVDSSRTAFRYLPGFTSLDSLLEKGSGLLVKNFVAVRWEGHKAFWQRQRNLGLIFRGLVKKGLFRTSDLFCMPFIGALPYYSNVLVLDFHGLTDKVIARSDPQSTGGIFHSKGPSLDYMEKRNVDFLIKYQSFSHVKTLPAAPLVYTGHESLDLQDWTDRRYLTRLGDFYMFFYSTMEPEELAERFEEHDFPLYIYVPESYSPVQGLLSKPVILEEWLEPK